MQTKRYITKYALTKGVTLEEGELDDKGNFNTGGSCRVVLYFDKEHFATAEEALADCEKRRLQKIASLKRQLEKLRSMTFEVEDDTTTEPNT